MRIPNYPGSETGMTDADLARELKEAADSAEAAGRLHRMNVLVPLSVTTVRRAALGEP